MAKTEVRGGQVKDASIDLAIDVTGTLPVGNGGTGSASLTNNAILLGAGTSALQTLAGNNVGEVPRWNGSTWESKQPQRQISTTTSPALGAMTVPVLTTQIYKVTALAANATVSITGTPYDGQSILVYIKDNGTSRTLTWNSVFRVIGVTLPSATTPNKIILVAAMYDSDTSKWLVTGVLLES